MPRKPIPFNHKKRSELGHLSRQIGVINTELKKIEAQKKALKKQKT